MNVKKISKLVVVVAIVFGVFSFGHSAYAATLAHYNGIDILTPHWPADASWGGVGGYSSSTAGSIAGIIISGASSVFNSSDYFTGYIYSLANGYICKPDPANKTYFTGGSTMTSYFIPLVDYSGTHFCVAINNDTLEPIIGISRSGGWFDQGSYLGNASASPYPYMAYVVVDSGGITPPNTTSRIDSLTYATSTAKATITGYWEATTTPYITQRLSFWQYSTSLGQERYQQLTATTTGAFNFTFSFNDPYSWTTSESSTTPIFSSFTLNASLDQYNETNYVFPYGGEIITLIDATSTTISTTNYNASDFISTPRALALYPEYDCGITSIMGCIKNAAIWLFYPTQDALDNWKTLQNVLQTKAPIGYFYMTKNAIGGLSATSTPSFSLTIPQHLKQYIFDPFDIGIAGILWFFFIFHFYKRLKHITI